MFSNLRIFSATIFSRSIYPLYLICISDASIISSLRFGILSKKAANYEKSVLVLHQGIDKYFGYQYELELGDIPDNFTYYAFGHRIRILL